MEETLEIPRSMFEEIMVFLGIYHIMHAEPSERFNKLMEKLEEYAE